MTIKNGHRWAEIFPAAIVWLTFILAIALSFLTALGGLFHFGFFRLLDRPHILYDDLDVYFLVQIPEGNQD
jgi:hypothetical protein